MSRGAPTIALARVHDPTLPGSMPTAHINLVRYELDSNPALGVPHGGRNSPITHDFLLAPRATGALAFAK